ncbi:MAG: hypothetical protein M3519_09540, partial [Actinomycetota bacterium]|nr:hypothetical protein [Actinomycetota bacterium]
MAPATDLVVVLPGIMGSSLRDADGRLVWGASAGAVMRALGSWSATLRRLQLPAGIGDEHPGDGIRPHALMPDVHALPGLWTPIKGYDVLTDRLVRLGHRPSPDPADPTAPPGNLLPVPYDWRLSNRYNGRSLADQIAPALERWRAQGDRYADAQVILVCHSMGGLVARWYLQHCDGQQVVRKLITFGTPWRGAGKALDQLVNGLRPGLGPIHLNLTRLARSLPSLHQLLPDYACLTPPAGHPPGLRTITETNLPRLDPAMVADAARFHHQLQQAETAQPESLASTHIILGARQPTTTTLTPNADGTLESHTTIGGADEYGDGTVPTVGALGHQLAADDHRLRRIVDQHGNLHRNSAALDELEEILTANPVRWRNPSSVPVRLTAPELTIEGEPVTVT